jgi:hypothetical protein
MWTYEPEELDPETPEGRKNIVRLLVGDTDPTDHQIQDEEISFATTQSRNLYSAASIVAGLIQAKFARLVTSEVDRTLRIRYSDMYNHYTKLADELRAKAVRFGSGLGVGAGGINLLEMERVRQNPTRPPAAYEGEFKG